MLAHVNTSGDTSPCWLDGPDPAIGWGRSTSYPYQEGSFFGNIFTSPPRPTTATARTSTTASSRAAWAPRRWRRLTRTRSARARLQGLCAAADEPNSSDGYKSCDGFTHVVTVWRQ